MIAINSINKYFGDHHVLKNISLDIHKGDKIVIVGASGSGKSTLIRCVNGLEKTTDGSIVIDGVDISEKGAPLREIRQKIAMVFQNFNLYPHMTVLENITLAPIKVMGISKKEAKASGLKYLERVGLSEKADAYPNKLSGGQKQRVAIARALNMHPEVILFDEPTSALDPEMIQEVLDVMIGLSEINITMVVVTHEMGFARKVADKVIFMSDGEIIEAAPPEQFFTESEHPRIQEFLSKIITH